MVRLLVHRDSAGFTLIEMSIVLVVIGLVVGGILVGQDLIKSAQMRATIAQLEKYNTAVNTFRIKYGQIPGDIDAQTASTFGLTTRSGNLGDGDADGKLEGCSSTGNGGIYGYYGCEIALFWADLSQAGLIDFSFSFTDTNAQLNVTSAQMPLYFPAAKIGNGSYLTVYNDNQYNYFVIAAIQGVPNGNYNTAINSPPFGMSLNQAYSIDAKIDDGLPTRGRVIYALGSGGFGCWIPASETATPCWAAATNSCLNSSVTPYTYAINGGNADALQCEALMIRFSE